MQWRERLGLLVLVDIQLGVRVCCPGGFEGNANKVFFQDVVEDGGAETTALVEDFVDDILIEKSRSALYSAKSGMYQCVG